MAAYCQVYGEWRDSLHVTCGLTACIHRDQLRAQRSVTSMGNLYLCLTHGRDSVLLWRRSDMLRRHSVACGYLRSFHQMALPVSRLVKSSKQSPQVAAYGLWSVVDFRRTVCDSIAREVHFSRASLSATVNSENIKHDEPRDARTYETVAGL